MEKSKNEMDDDHHSGLDVKKVNSIGTFPRKRANFSLNLSEEDKLYVIGGCSNQSEYEDFYVLDLKTYIWSRIPYPMKSALVGHKSVHLSSKESQSGALLVYGGWKTENYNDSLYLIELDTYKTKESRKVPKTFKTINDVKNANKLSQTEQDKPNSRRDHTLTLVESWDKVVLVGGWNSLQWSPTMVSLDVWWQKMLHDDSDDSYDPLNRRGHSAVYHPETDSLYIYGGVFGYSNFLGDCFKVKLLKNNLVKFEHLNITANPNSYSPPARAWHSASLIRNKIYYYGGMMNGSKFSNELITYDISKDLWSVCYLKGADMDRCAHSAVVLGTAILILGGYNAPESSSTSSGQRSRGGGLTNFLDMDCVLIIETENTPDNTLSKKMSRDSSITSFWDFERFPEIQELNKKKKNKAKREYDSIDKKALKVGIETKTKVVEEDPFSFLGETE